jgi:hypothetical protein
MQKTVGHVLRMTGLIIEMVGVWSVYRPTGANDWRRIQLADGTVVSLAWIAVCLGFILWLSGKILVVTARAPRPLKPPPDDGEIPIGSPP